MCSSRSVLLPGISTPLYHLPRQPAIPGHDVALAMLGSFQGTVDRLGLRWFASRSRNGTAGATAVCAPHIRHRSGAHGLTLLMPPLGQFACWIAVVQVVGWLCSRRHSAMTGAHDHASRR